MSTLRRSILSLALSTVVAGLASGPAAAVDGVLEINQVCAAGPGCFAGDPPGFPVRIERPGSYRLTGSLEIGADASAIDVQADGVTIDLNGFGVVGPASCVGTPVASCTPSSGSAGIDATGGQRVTVRNGFVRGAAGSGVALDSESRLEQVTLEANAENGMSGRWATTVTECIAHRNGQIGFHVSSGIMNASIAVGNGSSGVRVDGSTTSIVRDSVSVANGAQGFFTQVTRMEGVVAAANVDEGIEGGDPLVLESVLRGNGDVGLTLGSYGRSVIAGNGGTGSQAGSAKPIACNLVAGALTCPP